MTDFQQRYITARRAVIARDFQTLNDMQREGVLTTEGPLLLLAGAGSGKTTVLIQRVYNLLTYGRGSDTEFVPEDADADDLEFLEHYPANPEREERIRARSLCAVEPPAPWEVLAITFTNKAAGELKERLSERLGSRGNHVWASTFHACCVRILRRDIDRLGFDKNFTIYDSDDSRRVLKDILKEKRLEEKSYPPREVLSIISRAKDRYQNPEQFREENAVDGGDWRMPAIADIYAEYARRLRIANALDFDDLIFYTVTLLKTCPEVLSYYQDKFRYVLVDEYQDTNHLQYLLTSLLSGGKKNLCVVGDDDQSIYRFRGANIENILNFEKQYPNVRTIRLEQNYRSTQNILEAANAVIKNNQGRKGKTLWTANGIGRKVILRTSPNEEEEAASVVEDIMKNVHQGRRFQEHAALYRMNTQSNALERALRKNGIAYKVVGGMKFFDRAEIKDILAYLCVVNNPLDDLRLLRIINNPSRGIGAVTMEKTAALAEREGVNLFEILRNADLFPELKKPSDKLLSFANLIDGLREQVSKMPLADFYDLVCEKTGYLQMLQQKKDMESRGRLENVQELRSNIVAFLEQSPDDPSLSGFLNDIALYTDLDDMGSEDCVTLMTMHAAKGLEFPFVYVVGMEEGIFPSFRADESEIAMEEERRLCYVAMTRAKECLTLSHCQLRMLYGRTSSNPPSRFLDELPEKNIERLKDSWDSSSPFQNRIPNTEGTAVAEHRTVTAHTQLSAKKPAPTALGKTAAVPLSVAPNDRVEHTAFGQGTVLSVRRMGNDALLEVAFDNGSTRKLMLKTAAAHMKKLS